MSRFRLGLLVAIAVAATGLAALVISDPRRIGQYQGSPGRTGAPQEARWERATDAPVALTEVAAAAQLGRIWVAGGLDGDGAAVSRVLVYDPATDTWSEGPVLVEPVHHAALVSDGEVLYLIGGYAGSVLGRPTDAVWRLSSGADTWAPDRPLPEARAAGAAAWDGRGRILYGGGVGTDVSDDVFVREDGAWRRLAQLREPREHLAASSSGDGSVTFLGGRRGGLDGNLGTVDLVSAEGVVGRAEDAPTPRGGVAAFHTPSFGDCLVGGEGPNGTFGTIECVGVVATTTLPGLTVPRHGLGAAVLDGRAYTLLGGPQPGLTVSAVIEVLDLR